MRIFAWLSALLFFLVTSIVAYLFVPVRSPTPEDGRAAAESRVTVERTVTATFESLRLAVTKDREETEAALRTIDPERLLPRLLDLESHSPPRRLEETRIVLDELRDGAGLDLLALVSLRGDGVVSMSWGNRETMKLLGGKIAELARAIPLSSEVVSGVEALPFPDATAAAGGAPPRAMFFTAFRPLRARPDVVSGALVGAERLSGTVEGVAGRSALRWHLASDDVVIEGDLAGTELRRALVSDLRRRPRSSAGAFGEEGPDQIGLWGPLFSTSGAVTGAIGVTVPRDLVVSAGEVASSLSHDEGRWLWSSRLLDLACLVGGGLTAVFVLAALMSLRAGAGR